MTTATATQGIPATAPPIGFGATLASEWTKLRTIRATYIQLFLAIVLAIGMSALISLAIGSSWEDLSAADQADFDPVFTGFFGATFGYIVLVITGVTFVSSEYTSTMMRLTLTTTPRRGRIFAAKVLIITLFTLVVGFIVSFGSFFISQAVLGSYDVPTASLSDGPVLRAVLAGALTTPLYPLLGLALAFMLRSTASGITAIMALMFVPAIFGPLLPSWWEENLLKYVVGSAGDSLLMSREPADSLTYSDPPLAIAIVLAWLAVFLAGAYAILNRRDV